MKRHTNWDAPGFALTPAAPAVGPFPRRPFLRAVERLEAGRCRYELVESENALAALCHEDGVVRFLGSADLTDYHVPLGPGVADLMELLANELPAETRFDLDSLPIEAAKPIALGLERAGHPVEVVEDGLTAVVELPRSFDSYLEMIGKKQRHEVRRKRRRYEELLGEVVVETHTGTGWAFGEFVRLHRLADGPKGRFMTPETEAFFRELADTPGWRLDVLRLPDGRAAACSFSFVDEEGIYLYNGSYDPALSAASPGVVLLGVLIEQSIQQGIPRFDFLKGDEVYKFRLGAEARRLYRVRSRK